MHGALGAGKRMIRRAQQRHCRRFHRRRALADGFEHALDPGAERDDGGIDDAAAVFALAQQIAFGLRRQLLADVAMGGDPAAARHRPADQHDDAAVDVVGLGFGASLGDLAQAIGDVAVRIAGERAGGGPAFEQLAQRRAGAAELGPQGVHFEIAVVAQDQPRRAVEHAQPLRHVVERRAQQPALRPPPAGREQASEGGGAERKRQRHDGAGDDGGIVRQQAYDPARSEAEERREAGDKTDRTRQNHEWPTATCLGKGLSDNHSLCAGL